MKLRLSINLKKLWKISYILYTLGNFGVNMLGWHNGWVQIPLYLFFALSLFSICRNTRLFPKTITLWYTGFLIISILSLSYSPSFSVSVTALPDMIMALLWSVSVGAFLNEQDSIKIIKYSNIIISIPIGIYLALTFTQAHSWSRLGESFGMNENIVALCFLIPFCFAASELFDKKNTLINSVAIVICAYIMLLSGSKKAMLGAVLFLLALNVFGRKISLKKVFTILGVISGVILVFYFILHNEQLYNIIGYRLLLFWNTVTGKTVAGTSTIERSSMIFYGLKLFAQSPVLGHGINSFSYYYGNITVFYAYAHNNYIELVSTLGLLGLGWFYSIHFLTIKYYLRAKKMVANNGKIIAYIILILFYDIAMVSYSDTRVILLILCTYTMARNKFLVVTRSMEDK